jgi:hypothetical protein
LPGDNDYNQSPGHSAYPHTHSPRIPSRPSLISYSLSALSIMSAREAKGVLLLYKLKHNPPSSTPTLRFYFIFFYF